MQNEPIAFLSLLWLHS